MNSITKLLAMLLASIAIRDVRADDATSPKKSSETPKPMTVLLVGNSQCPEFKGNVKAVDTRDLWREADVSPSNQGDHYNHNAETYYETGDRLGRAMAELLKK